MASELLDVKEDAWAFQIYCKCIEAKDTWALRHSVLWPDRDISFVQLTEDDVGVHLGAFLVNDDQETPEVPVAIISLFTEDIPQALGTPLSTHATRTIRFRKFACSAAYQKKGIGSRLLEYAVSFAQSNMNGALLWCDVRTATLKWYQKRGLKQFGEPFYKGPVEYVRIQREVL